MDEKLSVPRPPATAPSDLVDLERVVGRRRGEKPGPTLVVVAGIHGNEPAGIRAARRVLSRLEAEAVGLRGELVVFSGNLAALRLGRRFQARDLNRAWTDVRVERLRAQAPEADDAEDREQRELLDVIDAAIARARGEVYLIDLHTTSAAGHPFVLFGDTLRQRELARAFPLPIILGLEECVDGVLSEYMTRRGCITLAVEGGQHQDAESVDSLEACITVALDATGIAHRQHLSTFARAQAHLERMRGGLPRVMEVLERHAIGPEDRFQMEPGFANLGKAREGQLLARDARGEIRADGDGVVMLPLYQGQGEDGFFWGREVSAARLAVSAVVRRMHLDRVLPLLPGVHRDPAHGDRLVVDTRVARYYPLDVFHVFGFRKRRHEGSVMTVARQPD